jgi:uncharacterized coiled-coil protein SlyX
MKKKGLKKSVVKAMVAINRQQHEIASVAGELQNLQQLILFDAKDIKKLKNSITGLSLVIDRQNQHIDALRISDDKRRK